MTGQIEVGRPTFLRRSEPADIPADDWDTLDGEVVRVTYFQPETRFCVARIRPDGFMHLTTVVGRMDGITAGARIHADGRWARHERHGLQFDARSVRVELPPETDGLVRYLGSGILPGIGPRKAEKLVGAFGRTVLDIVERDPRRLASEAGIPSSRIPEIRRAWQEQRRWIGIIQATT
ncbi:MAG TPA: hypothetical protein VK943_15715 [Arenibaculum sp.]|nr:hypothetical protein [Arenibaculum sp.]